MRGQLRLPSAGLGRRIHGFNSRLDQFLGSYKITEGDVLLLRCVLVYIQVVEISDHVEIGTLSAYHLYGNFGGKFPLIGPFFFLAPKTGTGLSFTIYKIPVNFSLSLDMKLGTAGNPKKWYMKCRSFR